MMKKLYSVSFHFVSFCLHSQSFEILWLNIKAVVKMAKANNETLIAMCVFVFVFVLASVPLIQVFTQTCTHCRLKSGATGPTLFS